VDFFVLCPRNQLILLATTLKAKKANQKTSGRANKEAKRRKKRSDLLLSDPCSGCQSVQTRYAESFVIKGEVEGNQTDCKEPESFFLLLPAARTVVVEEVEKETAARDWMPVVRHSSSKFIDPAVRRPLTTPFHPSSCRGGGCTVRRKRRIWRKSLENDCLR
jgi:hypothetical protein